MTRRLFIYIALTAVFSRVPATAAPDPAPYIWARQIYLAVRHFGGPILLAAQPAPFGETARVNDLPRRDLLVTADTFDSFLECNQVKGIALGLKDPAKRGIMAGYYRDFSRGNDIDSAAEIVDRPNSREEIESLHARYPEAKALLTLSQVGWKGDQALIYISLYDWGSYHRAVCVYRYTPSHGGIWLEAGSRDL